MDSKIKLNVKDVLLIIIVLFLLHRLAREKMAVCDKNAGEPFKPNGDTIGYRPCYPGPNCAADNNRLMTTSDLIIKNPFQWPYSGSPVIDKKVDIEDVIIANEQDRLSVDRLSLRQTGDHEILV